MKRGNRENLLLIVPNLHLGGQQRVAVNTVEILKDVCNVTMVVFDSANAVYEAGCEVVDLCCPAAPGRLRKVWNVFRRVVALKKLKKERKIGISYSYGNTANLVNALAKGRGKTIIRLSSYIEMGHSLKNRLMYRLSDSVVCCSRKLQFDMKREFPQFQEKIFCLQNPYNEKGLRKRGEEPVEDFDFGRPAVVAHGRLAHGKNHARLVKAFAQVHRECPDAQLLIIGEGELRLQLEQLIAQYQLSDCVTLIGFRPNPFAYLSKATVYALPSYKEGFPNALVEGMLFLPVVSVDCDSGPREILSEGPVNYVCADIEETDYGILVPPAKNEVWNSAFLEEDRTLADAILSLLKDPERCRVLKARAQTRASQFSYDSYRKQILEMFQK